MWKCEKCSCTIHELQNVEAVDDDEFDLSESCDDISEHFKRNLAFFI
jgi:hypothetical protein